MIEAKDIIAAAPGAIIATGVAPHRGQLLRYVAVRGGAPDWAVYVGTSDKSVGEVASNGDKVFPERSDFPVAATRDAIQLYRY